MSMTENARAAFDKLAQRGVEVTEPTPVEGDPEGTQFYLPHRSYSGHEVYVDTSRWRLIRESWVNGEFINPEGVRQDIAEVLAEYGLRLEYDDCPTAFALEGEYGFGYAKYNEKLRTIRESTIIKCLPDPPRMSFVAFEAMKEMARCGAPVWDFYSYADDLDPREVLTGAQFVMTGELEYERRFADDPDGATPCFPETQGLHPDVHRVARGSGLAWRDHWHTPYDREPTQKHTIAFFDPNDTKGRGTGIVDDD